MPSADYRCRDCGEVVELRYKHELPPVADTYCVTCSTESGGKRVRRFDRVWTPPAIGKVPGAGDSPSR